MKLKKLLQKSKIDLKEHYYEEAIYLGDNTSEELLSLILSSDEFEGVEKIEIVKNEDIKFLNTILLRDYVVLNNEIRIKLISFTNEGDVLLRVTNDSLKLIEENFKKEYRIVETISVGCKSNFHAEYSYFSKGNKMLHLDYGIPSSISWRKIGAEFDNKKDAIAGIEIYEKSRVKNTICHYLK